MKIGRMTVATTGEHPGTDYQVVVKGHLEPYWSQWFDGMAIRNMPNGEAVLSGPVADQAMLHGLLIKVRDLGLELVSIRCLGSEGQPKRQE
jgi:hypothetical protein